MYRQGYYVCSQTMKHTRVCPAVHRDLGEFLHTSFFVSVAKYGLCSRPGLDLGRSFYTYPGLEFIQIPAETCGYQDT